MPPKKLLSVGRPKQVLPDNPFANWFWLKPPIDLADMAKNNSNCWSSVDKEFSARCELADYWRLQLVTSRFGTWFWKTHPGGPTFMFRSESMSTYAWLVTSRYETWFWERRLKWKTTIDVIDYPRLIIVVDNLCSQPTEYFNWFLSVKRQLLICTTSYVSRTQLRKAFNELLTETLATNAIQVLGRDFCTWAVFLQLASKVNMLLHPVALTLSIRVVGRDWRRSRAAEQNSCRNTIGSVC